MEEKKYNIGQIAALSGVSPRTIRFYVQSGLLAAPAGAGRGHYYTDAHLQALQRIKDLKDNHLSLDEIARRLNGGPVEVVGLPVPTSWVRIEVCPGVEVHIQGGRYPVTPARMRRLQVFVQRLFGETQTTEEVDYDE
ncbi:MAG TPA: MerR family transcriptional regulator [Candidatus Rifleibacterium sp.]|nr:MerR family transcriptional regulator [Candidatus Rifleibacterium sp.]HPT47653.1 MerR family transcriptional regulator [Candidatus Rifleibacterium sp.]